ncbi:MAG: hypothetical protein AB1442_10620, partial [Nitrospirota bacterium]
KGEGKANVSRSGDLALRVYSFGFLAFELTSQDGAISSNPAIDRNKGVILTYGLRDCLFWWDIEDSSIDEQDNAYVFSNSIRSIWIDKATMLPQKQTISLSDGRELLITYERPQQIGGNWYPSRIRIQLSRYAVILVIKELSFILDA